MSGSFIPAIIANSTHVCIVHSLALLRVLVRLNYQFPGGAYLQAADCLLKE